MSERERWARAYMAPEIERLTTLEREYWEATAHSLAVDKGENLARIAKLEAELQECKDDCQDALREKNEDIAKLDDRIAKLEEYAEYRESKALKLYDRIAELEAALQPFANAHGNFNDPASLITLHDLRRAFDATAALQEGNK